MERLRGDRCFPVPPPVLAFVLFAHRVQHSHFSSFYARRFASALKRLKNRKNKFRFNWTRVERFSASGVT